MAFENDQTALFSDLLGVITDFLRNCDQNLKLQQVFIQIISMNSYLSYLNATKDNEVDKRVNFLKLLIELVKDRMFTVIHIIELFKVIDV